MEADHVYLGVGIGACWLIDDGGWLGICVNHIFSTVLCNSDHVTKLGTNRSKSYTVEE